MQHCIQEYTRIRERRTETEYIADALWAIANDKRPEKRLHELLPPIGHPAPEREENADEVIDSLLAGLAKLGKKDERI